MGGTRRLPASRWDLNQAPGSVSWDEPFAYSVGLLAGRGGWVADPDLADGLEVAAASNVRPSNFLATSGNQQPSALLALNLAAPFSVEIFFDLGFVLVDTDFFQWILGDPDSGRYWALDVRPAADQVTFEDGGGNIFTGTAGFSASSSNSVLLSWDGANVTIRLNGSVIFGPASGGALGPLVKLFWLRIASGSTTNFVTRVTVLQPP